MKRLFIFSTALSIAATCFAHDTWLQPDQFSVAPKTVVTLDLTSGMAYPALESGPKRERVQVARVRLAERTFDIADIAPGAKSLVFKTELADPGVATIWVKLPPRSIELKPAEVREYLDEIDAPAALRKEWTEMQPQRWRELYTKHPKTFVRVGDAKADRSWAEPVGMGLEFVPETDPTTLREGDELALRVLKDGRPFPGFSVNAVAGGETKGETKKSDGTGRIVFRLAKAGPWLLRGTDVRRSTGTEADWESDFATLTVEVKKK